MNTTQPKLPPNPGAGAQHQAATPAPAAGEMGGPIRGELSHLISWLTEASCQAANAGRSTDAGMLCWAAQVVSDRVDEDAPASPAPADPTKMVAPPAAQRILDAWAAAKRRQTRTAGLYEPLAAALEALADEVVPEMEEPDWGACNEMRCDIELYTDHQRKRSAILAIAAELRRGFDG